MLLTSTSFAAARLLIRAPIWTASQFEHPHGVVAKIDGEDREGTQRTLVRGRVGGERRREPSRRAWGVCRALGHCRLASGCFCRPCVRRPPSVLWCRLGWLHGVWYRSLSFSRRVLRHPGCLRSSLRVPCSSPFRGALRTVYRFDARPMIFGHRQPSSCRGTWAAAPGQSSANALNVAVICRSASSECVMRCAGAPAVGQCAR